MKNTGLLFFGGWIPKPTTIGGIAFSLAAMFLLENRERGVFGIFFLPLRPKGAVGGDGSMCGIWEIISYDGYLTDQ
jgi:hypothetical protein